MRYRLDPRHLKIHRRTLRWFDTDGPFQHWLTPPEGEGGEGGASGEGAGGEGGAGGAGAGGEGGAGAGGKGGEGEGAGGAKPEEPAPDADKLGEGGKKALEAERKARREADRQLAEAQKKLKEHEDAKLSDAERSAKRQAELETRSADLERELQESRVSSAFERAAAKAGATHPDAIYKLADAKEITFDTDGAPTNIDALVEGLKKQYPAMFGTVPRPSVDGGARPGQGAGGFDSKQQLERIKQQTNIT